MSSITHYRDHVGSTAPKFYKTTMFRSDHLMLGLNCLEPGQQHAVHTHTDQDKFYMVLEGTGRFTVGDETRDLATGNVVWAAAGVPHGVHNTGDVPLVVLVGIAPAP